MDENIVVNFRDIEKKWQKAWSDKKAFEPKIEKDKSKFFFSVPYPYVSGALHVGHGRTYVSGDVLVRFKRMKGFNVLWPIGFHITGTPVVSITQRIAAGDEKIIKLYNEYVGIYEEDKSKVPAIVESFGKDPWNVVNYFSKKMVFDFESMGFSLDLSRQFTTGDKEYNAFVAWQFHKLKDAGYLKQASYPVLYCPVDKNAVGEDDIADADTDKVEVQRFTAIKFKLEDQDACLTSATLRTDTLFGITNVFVNPKDTYDELEVTINGKIERIIVARDAVKKVKLQHQNVKATKEMPGSYFVGKMVVNPVNGKLIPVLPAAFVESKTGTGVVHAVPAHAPFDFVAIEELKHDEKTLEEYKDHNLREKVNAIELIQVIESSKYGKLPAADLVKEKNVKSVKQADVLKKLTTQLYKDDFYEGKVINSAQFTGMRVEDAKDKSADWAKAEGFGFDFFETSRPAVSRSGGEVMVAVLPDQWFIDFNAGDWKEKAKKCLDNMSIYPASYRKLFEDTFSWLDKRPCARRRGLGTLLPFNNEWIIESLSDSTIYPAFYTVIKKSRELGVSAQDMSVEFFDFVYLGKGKAHDKKWEQIREEFLYWYPSDQRHTAPAHVSNHLSFYIFNHVAIFEERHWPKSITLNELLISEGTKMSKSKGNVVTLDEIRRNYTADLYRLYVLGTADFASVVDFRKKEIETFRKKLTKFYNTVSEVIELSKKENETTELTGISSWMVSKFESTIINSEKAINELRVRDYVQQSFFETLNNWDYFAKRASDGEKIAVAKHMAKRWILLLTPVIPHTCEELWSKLGEKEFASLSKWPEAHEDAVDKSAEQVQDYLLSLTADLRKLTDLVMRKNSGKKPTKATLIVCSKGKWKELLSKLKEKDMETALYQTKDENMKSYLEKWFHAFKDAKLKEVNELAALTEAKTFLEQDLGLTITIESETTSKNEKAQRALPLKPSIELQ